MIAIYCLRDSEGVVRYVGKTSQNLKIRLNKHISDARGSMRHHLICWLRSLPGPPAIEVIEWAAVENWEERERYWIALFRDYGHRLVNGTPGGPGGGGRPMTARNKEALAKAVRVYTPEIREHMAAAQRGKIHSPATRAKMSIAQMALPYSPQAAARMRARFLGKKQSPELLAKLSAVRKGRKASLKTRYIMSIAQRARAIEARLLRAGEPYES